jgi:threonine dehydrogenase-like Zn-dependent dehydrogenase
VLKEGRWIAMKASVLSLDGLESQKVQTPQIKNDQVLVKTLACGVCSGDLYVYQNRSRYVDTYNRLGHEASGVVADAGSQVADFQPGDVVTALSLPAYAEYFVAAPEELVKLPPKIDPTYALGEAVACCVHAANRFCINPGDKVAVVGCGFMGLICLQLAKIQGAGFICALDPLLERQEMARRFGADSAYNPLTVSGADILQAHGEFDVVIEAAGVQSAVDLCTELVAQHGRIILIGYHQSNNGLRMINMEQWNYKAIDVVNGHVRRQDEKLRAMQQGMEMLAKGQLHTKPLVTTYGFSDIETAFADLSHGKPGLLKAVLLM